MKLCHPALIEHPCMVQGIFMLRLMQRGLVTSNFVKLSKTHAFSALAESVALRLNSMQVYCVFLFMSSAFLFGILVSQINEIVAAKQVKTKELDTILDAYISINPK